VLNGIASILQTNFYLIISQKKKKKKKKKSKAIGVKATPVGSRYFLSFSFCLDDAGHGNQVLHH
jgi:hypothetical protein